MQIFWVNANFKLSTMFKSSNTIYDIIKAGQHICFQEWRPIAHCLCINDLLYEQ